MRSARKLRLQFGLRSFLILTMIAGLAPWLYVQYQNWREAELWNAYDAAQAEREELVQQWRMEYAACVEDKAPSSAEAILRKRYLSARSEVETKWEEICSFYGTVPKERPAASFDSRVPDSTQP